MVATRKRIVTVMCAGALFAGVFAAPALAGGIDNKTGSDAAGATVAHDFTQLSAAGNRAFIDVLIARSALFDGHPELASKLVNDAKSALQVAKTDHTAFVKAEAGLSSPPGKPAPQNPDKRVIAWLPVGGDVVVTDDFVSRPEKAKAIASANAALKKGDRDAAIQTLKLANVNTAYSVDVVPLEQTASRIDEAAGLLSAGKYYEAGQVLHHIQDSARTDWLDIQAVPKAVKPAQKASQK